MKPIAESPGAAALRPAVASAAGRRRHGTPEACCGELRCGCGSLLARRVAAGVELKCRRCKRTLVLPLGDG